MKNFFKKVVTKIKSFFKTVKKSNHQIYLDKYTDILPVIDGFFDRFTNTDIIIDFPTSSMLHLNIPRYLYKKYGKYNFTKESADMGLKLTYSNKCINLILTYSMEGRVDSNITVKIGNDIIEYIVYDENNDRE